MCARCPFSLRENQTDRNNAIKKDFKKGWEWEENY